MIFRFRNIALAALCCVLTTGLSAWAAASLEETGETVPTTTTLAFKGATLSELTEDTLYGIIGGSWAGAIAGYAMTFNNFDRSAEASGTITCQAQVQHGENVKGVLLTFTQDGSNVNVIQTGAKYVAGTVGDSIAGGSTGYYNISKLKLTLTKPAPIAVFDGASGGFKKTSINGVTFAANGNTVAEDGSYVKISASVGALFKLSQGYSYVVGEFTVTNLNESAAADRVLALWSPAQDGTSNSSPGVLLKSGTVNTRGIWNNALWGDDQTTLNGTLATGISTDASRTFVLTTEDSNVNNVQNDTGTHLFELTGADPGTAVYGGTTTMGLRGDQTYRTFVIGGPAAGSLSSMTDLVITKVVIYATNDARQFKSTDPTTIAPFGNPAVYYVSNGETINASDINAGVVSFGEAFVYTEAGSTINLDEELTDRKVTFVGSISGVPKTADILTLGSTEDKVTTANDANVPYIKGAGTVVYTGASPGSGQTWLTQSEWTGVLWLKNVAIVGLVPANLANANSTLRLTGVTGYFNNGGNTSTCDGTLDLQDDGDTKALTVNNGWSDSGISIFNKLIGSGTITCSERNISQRYVFKDPSEFTGTISCRRTDTGATYLRVILGDGATLSPANGTITVVSGADVKVASGKTWTASAIDVQGTLKMEDSTSTLSGTVKGSGKIIYNDVVPNNAAFIANTWTGTVEINGGTTTQAGIAADDAVQFMNSASQFTVASGTVKLGTADGLTGTVKIEGGATLSVESGSITGTFGGAGTLAGNVTFGAGAKFKVFPHVYDSLTVSGTIAYPAGDTVKVDVSSIYTDDITYIPLLSGIAAEDIDKFELADSSLPLTFTVWDGVLGLTSDDSLYYRYEDYVTFTLNNIGTTPITNYTLLVRISKAQLPGFSYERAGDGSEIAFSDGYGAPLSYDIDTWNTKGESLVWVKVPAAENGQKITFYWSLKEGKSKPTNVSSDVWTDYAGVWHMDDTVDASGNSADGALHANSVKRSDGKFGGAYGRTENGVKGPIATIPKSEAMNDLTNDAFTVSAWVRLNAASGLNYPYFFSRKDVNASNGWGVQLDGGSSTSNTKIWPNGTSGNSIVFTPAYKANDWVYMSVVLANGSATMFVDGVQYGPTANASFVPATDTSLDFYIGGARADDDGDESNRTNTLNGDMDEVRLYKGAVSADQVKAEYANIQQTDFLNARKDDGASFLVPGVVVVDGDEHDYWLSGPSITPNFWKSDAPPTSVTYTEGVLRSGSSVTNWCENRVTHAVYDISLSTLTNLTAGSYRIHCARKDAENVVITGETWVDFIVSKNSGTASAGDTAGGRILLMNNDFSQGGTADAPTIGSQGYSDTNETAAVYWQFADRTPSDITTMNVMDGTNSILWSVSDDKSVTNKLWHLVASRHGNTFPSDGSGLDDSQNYLPWSTSSCSLTNGTVAAQSGADAGQILMLNTTEAAVYSPCYDEGIGTIYFDAVNGWNDDLTAYQLIVEYATATTNGDSVVDANLWQYDDDGNVTNYYGNLDATCWQACEVNVARVTGGDTVNDPVTYPGAFNLEVEPGRPTTTGEFYRVYAKLNMREPVRFRIRRTSIDGAKAGTLDSSYLLLDNIIVSYPAMGATLSPAGWYDETKKGANVVGFEGAFTKAFPAVGDTVHGKATVEYYVNSSQPLTETNFFASATMNYRWRYLKNVSEWKSVALDPDDDFRSAEPLELPDEVGDIEFWYEYVLQAPYYSYADYTGLPNLENAFAAKYSEATLGPQTNRSTKVDFSYPTFGNDWFVRLRASSSSNEVWRVFVRNADGSAYATEDGTVEYIDLAVTDSGSWRGFLRTPAAVEGGLEYRVEQINPQADDADFAFSTNYWKGVAVFTDTIKSVNLTAAGIDEWSTVPCAATTGFMMFVLDEGTPSLSVTSADLQNFDKWNDANKNDRLFVGTSAEDSAKSGVSHTMRTYEAEFDMWAPSLATNKYWNESFIATIGSAGFPGYTTLDAGTKTPNGWTSGKGMWIYGKFKDYTDSNTMALQMAGRGEGYLAFTGAAENPRGIESISLRSRIAQSVAPSDFAFRDEGVGKSYTNYCFVVQAAMSTNVVTSGGAWDSRFDGLGQISVFGGYRVNKGGYELRITRWREGRYRAELYRWVGNTPEVVNSCEADLPYAQMPYTIINDGSGEKYPTLYISVSYQADGSCKVQAGFSSGAKDDTSPKGHSAPNKLPETGSYINLAFWDDAPPTTYGSYGIASANCDAVFTGARFCNKSTEWLDTSLAKGTKSSGFKKKGCSEYTPGDGATLVAEDIAEDWSLPARFEYDTAADKLLAVAEAQKLLVQWKRHGESELEWKTIATTNISSYTLSDTITIPVLFKEEADIRIKHGGSSSDDNCVDLVVDDVSVRQWCGDDYDNTKTQPYFTDKDVLYGSPTNFVFTSAWLNEEGSVELTAARAPTNAVSSLRSPLMDGSSGRGVGLGMFSFSYTNADSRAVLSLQIATNVTALTLAEYTGLSADDSRWLTVTNFTFSAMSEEELAGGVLSYYLGMHGVKGAMRLVVDPDTAVAADAAKDAAYGRIFITQVICRDEPSLDSSCWWGWNIRTGEDLYSADDKLLMNLSDWPGSGGAGAGMSFALNNSVVDDTAASDPLTYRQHQPFLQTPIFTNNTAVGEITFKARRYDMPSELTPRVCIYGANPSSGHVDTSDDANWTYVTHFDVTNDFYRTYTKKFKGASYETLRLVVVGVDNVAQKHGKPTSDAGYKDLKDVVRVALDDVVVTESLTPKLAFRNVFAFRGDESTDLLDTHYVDRFGDISAQPLAGEGWGVQAEIVAEQLPDEIDFDRGIEVTLYWYDGGMLPWGFSKWSELSGVHSAKLVKCDDKDLAFRGSFNDGHSGASIVGQLPEYPSGTIVQYMLRAAYYLKESDELQYSDLKQEQWTKPEWFRGIDYNTDFEGFAAYTILDSVAPGWAWVNEVNVFGGYESYKNVDADRQYVEIAMPVEADLTGWTLEFISRTTTNKVCRFGANGVPGRKKTNSSENCAFLVISSPTSKSNLEAMTVGGKPVVVDGTWTIENTDGWNFQYNDRIDVQLDPIAVRLSRPSGIIEHEITFEGTNLFQSVETSAATFAADLNAAESGANWVAVGDDSIEGDHSLGVTNSPANLVANWSNTISRTPGFINDNQKINPDHPIANGVSYVIYATLAEDSAGHMTQSLGNDIKTTSLAMAVVPKGTATNITYDVENWYELDSVKVNGDPLSLSARTGKVDIILGGEATSNNLTVVAASRVNPVLAEDYELTTDNRYTSAVVDWLNKGVRMDGTPFEHPEGPIKAAAYCEINGTVVTNLTLTEMYWLDIDPTEGDWQLRAGMINPPVPVAVKPKYEDGDPLTNLRMGIYMCLTNTATTKSFSPYVLRGVAPGSLSTNYTSDVENTWDGPTFRILGRLYNAVVSGGDEEYFDWVALRWFVFNEDSFGAKGSSVAHQSTIDIRDPYSQNSPAYIERWDKWKGNSNVFFKWSIDGDTTLFTPQTLCPTNWISY